jgi:photosystem II stability/assembly factor-like uncharacterized protein
LAFSHGSPPTLYAAVGGRGDVYASVDGAQSWARLGNYELTGFGSRLVVAPGNADLLFVAEDVRGAYRSLDGGRNWLPVSQGLPKDSNGSHNVQSVAIDPTDSNVVYVGTGWGPFGGNGVYKSTDGGENWSPANRGMIDYSITTLAIDPANPQTVYAGGNGGELFKSADGGQTWDNLTDRLAVPSERSRSALRAILLDPATPQTVYLLGEREGVMVSADGGGTWRLLGKPGGLDNPTFSALIAIFGEQPILIAGIGGEGGWRYSRD